ANPEHWDPTGHGVRIDVDSAPGVNNVVDADQQAGASPLEAANLLVNPVNNFGSYGGVVYMRIKRNSATPVGASPDTIEVALGYGLTELGYSNVAGSGAKPATDSKNPGMLAVGAVEPAAGSSIAVYSSQGPTTDGRIKPDISAPSGLVSTIYAPSKFSGTSAASPTAAGLAALLQSAGQASPGLATAQLMRRIAADYGDLGAVGPDNAFGAGKVFAPYPLPAAPPPIAVINSAADVLLPAQRLQP
ncbi:MAG: S8 family serine peptidase, partial [Actinomycetota bacterium]